jgi:hypothetical protein
VTHTALKDSRRGGGFDNSESLDGDAPEMWFIYRSKFDPQAREEVFPRSLL